MKNDLTYLNADFTVLYDGWCRLCSGVVGLLMKTKAGRQLHYESLQNIDNLPCNIETKEQIRQVGQQEVVVLYKNEISTGASAGLIVLKQLGGIYLFLGRVLSLLPMVVLNKLYTFIARNRYRWFGRNATCERP